MLRHFSIIFSSSYPSASVLPHSYSTKTLQFLYQLIILSILFHIVTVPFLTVIPLSSLTHLFYVPPSNDALSFCTRLIPLFCDYSPILL